MDLMIDLETLATSPDAFILSIGAAAFDRKGQGAAATFYRVIRPEQPGRVASADTALWWMQQSEQARKAVAIAIRTTLADALSDLAAFHWAHNCRRVWAKGPKFDIDIVEHAMAQCGLRAPWHWSDWRDVRSYLTLSEDIDMPPIERDTTRPAHDALADALYQVEQVQAVYHFALGKRRDEIPQVNFL